MRTSVLLSGGLDSAVLLAEEAARSENEVLQPIYIRVGLAWERAEQTVVRQLIAAGPLAGRMRPLASLSVDMRDVYAASHWAIAGHPPGYHTPDEEVYLPGRNVILLGKAGVYCAAAYLDRLVLGTLAHNPFPDATPAFLLAMAKALSLGLAHSLTIDAPYASVSKSEVIRRGVALGVPFQLTLSCMKPVRRVQAVQELQEVQGVQRTEPLEPSFVHCGTCSKCRERHHAFLEAGVIDSTEYADRRYVRAEP